MKVLVSRDDAWNLENSMFVVEGCWETGFILDADIFFMVGVTTYCLENARCNVPNIVSLRIPNPELSPLEIQVAKAAKDLEYSPHFWLRSAAGWAKQIQFHLSFGEVEKGLSLWKDYNRCVQNHFDTLK